MDRGIALDPVHQRSQLRDHLGVQGVELVGAVDGGDGDAVAQLEQQSGVGHA
jgi:hypothetical protein